jgi:hypothetical protein
MAYIDKGLTLPEVFKRVAEKETIEEKAKLLKAYETKSLRWFIDSLYNRDLSDIVIPEYKVSKNPSGIAFMNINNSMNRIEAAISNKDKPWIVNRNLTLVLEGVTSEEASLIEKLLKGERRITGVSKTVFKKAYPEFFRTEEEVQ